MREKGRGKKKMEAIRKERKTEEKTKNIEKGRGHT